jgi:hypothetical protein
MLDPNRSPPVLSQHVVQLVGRERTGNRLVVSVSPEPLGRRTSGEIAHGLGQSVGKRRSIDHGRRSAPDGPFTRGQAEQVDVMVVEPGEECSTSSVEDVGPSSGAAEPLGLHRRDPAAFDVDGASWTPVHLDVGYSEVPRVLRQPVLIVLAVPTARRA